MRAPLLALALLAALAPFASAACAAGACATADTASASNGTCGGVGFERNTADASASTPRVEVALPQGQTLAVEPHAAVARAETFCLRTAGDDVRQVNARVQLDGRDVFLSWWSNGPTCQVTLVRDGATTDLFCATRPPQVPAVLP